MNEEKKTGGNSVSKRYKAALDKIANLQCEVYRYYRMCRLRRQRVMDLIRENVVLKYALAGSVIINIVAIGAGVINIIVSFGA